MDVQRALRLLRRWWPVLLAGTLLAAGASYVVSKAQPRVYEATSLLRVNPGLPDIGGGGNFNEYQAAWSLATEDARLLQTMEVAQGALASTSSQLRHELDSVTLLKNTKATALPQQALVTLAIRASDPNDAQLLANAMSDTFVRRDAKQRSSAVLSLNDLNRRIRDLRNDAATAQQQNTQLQLQRNLSPSEQHQSGALIERISGDQAQIGELQNTIHSIYLRLAGTGSTASVAAVAQKPIDPIAPRTTTNVLVAAILTLLALLGVAALTDALDTRPRSAAEVASALDLPLAGTIDLARGGAALVALHDPASPATDEYRLLRTTLGLGAGPERAATARVLAVTGTTPGSGASTVAANLAAVTARSGARVVLVDANLRRPALHAAFDLPDGAGLSTALRDGDDPTILLQTTAVPGLRLLTAGPAAAAIDLLDSTRMQAALATLRGVADLVVVDTGTAALPEAVALARLADGTLLVAAQGVGDKATLATVADRLRLAGGSLAGVVVTFVGDAGAHSRGRQRHAAAPPADRVTGEPVARTSTRPGPAK